jgi:Ca-activated chloride channel family protein
MNEVISFGDLSVLSSGLLLLPFLMWLLFKLGQRRRILRMLKFSDWHVSASTRRSIALMAVVLSLFLALLQPRYGFEEVPKEINGRDVFIVMDYSYSMWAQDIQPSRLERANREIADLISMVDGDRIGLIGFAAEAYARMPLTNDYAQLQKVLRDTTPQVFRSQGSNMAAGVQLAIDMLVPQSGEQSRNSSILLISDGENHQQDVKEVAQLAKDSAIRIYSLSVGTEQSVPLPIPSGGFVQDSLGNIVMSKRVDAPMAQLAKVSGGAMAISVAGGADMTALYLDGIQGKATEGILSDQDERIWNEFFQWPLAFGLLSMLIAFAPRRIALRQFVPLLALLFITPVEADESMGSTPAKKEAIAIDLLKRGRASQAQQLLEEVIQHSNDPALKERARYNAGIAAYQAGQLDRALGHWNQILQINPDHEASKQNIEAVQQEIQQRMMVQQQQPQEQQSENQEGEEGQEQGEEQQEGEEGDSQEGEEGQEQQGEQSQSEALSEEGSDQQSPEQQQAEESKQDASDEETPEGDSEGEATSDAQDSEAEPEEGSESAAGQGNEEIDWDKERAKRLIDSVEEGQIRGGYRGMGSGEKGW